MVEAPGHGGGGRRDRRATTNAARTAQRRSVARCPPWKAVVTIALLGVLATAVTIVLLQSAGIISWSILGPTS